MYYLFIIYIYIGLTIYSIMITAASVYIIIYIAFIWKLLSSRANWNL